jgi:hypothetical protein
MTGMWGRLTLDSQTGLLTANYTAPIGFGVAQLGNDIPASIGGFMTPMPIWEGESPQYVGLDQVNVAFPTCTNRPIATVEKRYDAFLEYSSVETSTTVRIHVPFVVRPGDPDCQWLFNTTTSLFSSPNPSVAGQAVKFTVSVYPSAVTGTVTFFDGSIVLGGGAVSNGIATFTTSSLSAGVHSIVATYNGDSNYGSSSAKGTQTVKAATP